MPGFDVVGFGALNVDKLFKVNRIAEAEEESFVQSHVESCGGSAANTMVGLARLGCRVGFVGKVAADREGALLLEDFQKEDVDSGGVVRADHGHSGQVIQNPPIDAAGHAIRDEVLVDNVGGISIPATISRAVITMKIGVFANPMVILGCPV